MAGKPLSDKQKRFVEEYLIDLDPGAAYLRAGYKSKPGKAASNNALRLMENDGIATAIRDAQQARSNRTQVTVDQVVKELARIGFSDPRKLYCADGTLKPIHELDDDSAAVLAHLEILEEFEGHGDDRHQIGFTKKLKLWDKVSALEKLGKHLGMFKERVEHTGKDGGPIEIETIEVVRPHGRRTDPAGTDGTEQG